MQVKLVLVDHKMEHQEDLVVELLEEIQLLEQVVQVILLQLVLLKETLVVIIINLVLLIIVLVVEELLQQANLFNQVTLVLVVEVQVQQVL